MLRDTPARFVYGQMVRDVCETAGRAEEGLETHRLRGLFLLVVELNLTVVHSMIV